MKLTSLKKIAAGVTLGLLMTVGSAGSAHADWHHGPDRGWDHHAQYAHRHWGRDRYQQGVVYAPPVAYSQPYASPGINLVLPLNFR